MIKETKYFSVMEYDNFLNISQHWSLPNGKCELKMSHKSILYVRHVKLKAMCGPHFHIQRQKKLSAGHSFEKFSKFYYSEFLLYDNLSKYYLINVILKSNKIAAGRIGQAMGPPV
jgi:hypothetical protein